MPLVVYPTRFMAWWGIALYLFRLGSRRQLDHELSADSRALENLNRLAGTSMTTRPVHDTLDHFLGHSSPDGFSRLRQRMIYRLVRMKVFDPSRVQGRLRVAVDGTGHLSFARPHCGHCLVQKHQSGARYLHQVLEAKPLGPGGLALSIASAFIDNADAGKPASAEQRKQDCELAALDRLALGLKRDFPQARLCLSGDSLFACGRALQVCKDNKWSFLFVFEPGRTPALYAEFEQLLQLCPKNRLRRETDGVVRECRWVVGLRYEDSEGREWEFNALECKEIVEGVITTFAWITDLKLTATTVERVAASGRAQWRIENEGFNTQKNSDLNLEHVYSIDPEKLKAYYLLLQMAHVLIQLLERGSLLWHLAAESGKTPVQLFGSQKNVSKRLLEGMRYGEVPERAARAGQIRLVGWDTS
ncbi:MAG TPA: hypothetical protein VKD72_38580 [Gemmataceae bacterium]|nr:hypothetical protein [Gemmataceae bacterium]